MSFTVAAHEAPSCACGFACNFACSELISRYPPLHARPLGKVTRLSLLLLGLSNPKTTTCSDISVAGGRAR